MKTLIVNEKKERKISMKHQLYVNMKRHTKNKKMIYLFVNKVNKYDKIYCQ
jgi:hypothetical protein